MYLTLAAAGAAAVALLEVTLWPYLGGAGAHLHPVFAGTVLLAGVATIETALVWAFAGGLMLDVLSPRPLGTTVLVLLLAAGIAAASARALAQVRVSGLAPIVVAFPLSLACSLGIAFILAAVTGVAPPKDAVPGLVPGAIADTALVGVVVALTLARRSRREEPEHVGW